MTYRNVRSFVVLALAMGSLAALGCGSDDENFAVEQSSGLTARAQTNRAEPCLSEWRAWDKANDAVLSCARVAELNDTCSSALGAACGSCVGHACSTDNVRLSDTRRALSSCLSTNGKTLDENDVNVEVSCGGSEAAINKGDPTVGRGAGKF